MDCGPLERAVCGGMCVILGVTAAADIVHLGDVGVAPRMSRQEVLPVRDETHRESVGWVGIAMRSVEVASTASQILASSRVRYVGAAGEPRVAEIVFPSL